MSIFGSKKAFYPKALDFLVKKEYNKKSTLEKENETNKSHKHKEKGKW
ncbi:MAG: hypothetical protein ACD_11C00090G0008 [uncultured bacterium]|nr:MAG: hypothetical protein ACD_11C00090G0008 [uncultured bacterium]